MATRSNGSPAPRATDAELVRLIEAMNAADHEANRLMGLHHDAEKAFEAARDALAAALLTRATDLALDVPRVLYASKVYELTMSPAIDGYCVGCSPVEILAP